MAKRAGLSTYARFAIPGELGSPTGGYEYARRILELTGLNGLELRHVPLSGRFPYPTDADIETVVEDLSTSPQPVLFDGLALGAMPIDALARIKAPIIALCHHPLALETGLNPAEAERFRKSERAALAYCQHVITTSETTASILQQHYGIPKEKLTIALPGTDIDLHATSIDQQPARTTGKLHILGVGSLIPRKGWHDLVAALAKLNTERWHLSIAGSDQLDPNYAEKLRAQISQAGLTQKITLLGAVTSDDLARLYQSADIFCLPSHYEGYGMVLAEAMATGLPILTTNGGAIPEVVEDAALVVEKASPKALRVALASLITQPTQRENLRHKAILRAKSLPSWEDAYHRIAKVMQQATDFKQRKNIQPAGA